MLYRVSGVIEMFANLACLCALCKYGALVVGESLFDRICCLTYIVYIAECTFEDVHNIGDVAIAWKGTIVYAIMCVVFLRVFMFATNTSKIFASFDGVY